MNQNPPDNAAAPRSVDQQQACSAWASLREKIDELSGNFNGYAWDNGAGSSGYNKAVADVLAIVDTMYTGEHVHACPQCASSVSWLDQQCYHCGKLNDEMRDRPDSATPQTHSTTKSE